MRLDCLVLVAVVSTTCAPAKTAHAQAPAPPPVPAPAPPAEPPADTGLQAGGLKPPEAVDTSPPEAEAGSEAQVERALDQAEAEDTGRGLEFVWAQGEVGYQFTALQALSGSDLVDGTLVEDSSGALVYGGGLGGRFFVITAGARFRFADFTAYNMWSLNGEAGLRIPFGDMELFIVLGGGYTSLGGFVAPSSTVDFDGVGISGFNLRTGGGVEVYLSETFSVGAMLNGEIAFLSRSGVSVGEMTSESESLYARDGSSVGMALTATALVGLHF